MNRLHHAIVSLMTLGGQPPEGPDLAHDRRSYHTIEFRRGATNLRTSRGSDDTTPDAEALRLAS